jgi:hypothetical protein
LGWEQEIKIGADGSYDGTEYRFACQRLLVITWSWMREAVAANSILSHRIAALAFAAETYDNLAAMGAAVNTECTALMRTGLDVCGMHFTFRFWFCADAKIVRLAYGKRPVRSTYFCIYCRCTLAGLPASLHASTSEWDIPLDAMPTTAEMAKLAKDYAFAADNHSSWVSDKTKRGKASDYESQEAVPVFTSIDPRYAPLEPLHLLMRVFGILERVVACALGHKGTVKQLRIQLHKDKRYKKLLTSMGVYLHINKGLRGHEVKRVLRNSALYCSLVPKYGKREQLQHALDELHWLYTHGKAGSTTAAAWKARAQAFTAFMYDTWPLRVGRSFYLHGMGCHLHRWWPFYDFSTQALEAVNAAAKRTKHRHTAPDKKEATKRAATGRPVVKRASKRQHVPRDEPVLRQIANHFNRRVSGATMALNCSDQHPRRQQCTTCGDETHNAGSR